MGLSAAVLLGLSGAGAAAHADIFNGAAEAGHFVALKMGQADKYVSIHNSTADFGIFHIFSAVYRNINVVSSL